MAEKFEVYVEAERFIHNDISSVAFHLYELVERRLVEDARDGIALEMTACLTFYAFAIEAKVNFVGWKIFGDEWPERKPLKEKINKICDDLSISKDWSVRPLSTFQMLKSFRDTLAHGKPEIVDEKIITDVEPEIWDALRGQWEKTVTFDNMKLAKEDIQIFWCEMLGKSGIEIHQTLTRGGHSLHSVVRV